MSDETDLQEFLKKANIAVLATVDGKGRPHAAPVWYLYDNGDLLVSTGEGSQKHRNIQRNPEIALVIDSRELPYFSVTVSGRAQVEPALTDDKRLELATRYLGDEMGKAYTESTAGGNSITIRLRPERTATFNGRAGR